MKKRTISKCIFYLMGNSRIYENFKKANKGRVLMLNPKQIFY